MFFGLFGPGLGKRRSSFGEFLYKNGITQEDLTKASGVSNSTISRLCQPQNEKNGPNMKNAAKIIRGLRKMGYNVDIDNFWGL